MPVKGVRGAEMYWCRSDHEIVFLSFSVGVLIYRTDFGRELKQISLPPSKEDTEADLIF